MTYLFNADFLKTKLVFSAFIQIYGIGKKTSIIICKWLGFSLNFKVQSLSKNQMSDLTHLVERLNLTIAWNLKVMRGLYKKTAIEIKAYKGLWWIKGLPIRGQWTRTNGKTAKKLLN